MMKQLAATVHEQLIQWLGDNQKLIVAIDGYPGSGKSTLLKELANYDDVVGIERDDFIRLRDDVQALIEKTGDAGEVFFTDAIDNEQLAGLITKFRQSADGATVFGYNPQNGLIDRSMRYDFSRPILVVEGIFLFEPSPLNILWDKRILLTGNEAQIDARRVAREKAKWGADYFPENHPDSYLRQICERFRQYERENHPAKQADLVLTTTEQE